MSGGVLLNDWTAREEATGFVVTWPVVRVTADATLAAIVQPLRLSDQNINNKVDSTTSVVLSFLNMYVYLPTRRARHHQNMRYDFSFLLGMYMLTCVTSPTIE